ncbi:MAG: transposase [Candidatus Hydrothermarchaeaceae archaeon]
MRLVSPVEYLASLLVELHLTDKSEYSARDYASLVLFAAKSKDYVETVTKVMKGLPNVDTLFLNLKPNNTLGDLEDALKAFVTPLVNPLGSKLPHRKFTIAMDITYQPYYGKKPNAWIHSYKPVKGATGCYKFLVMSIVSYSRRFILAALPIPVISRPMAWYAERLLDFVFPLLPIERVLMDRGFYDFKLMDRLHKRGLKYIILTPQKEEYEDVMERGDGVYPYSSTYSEGKTKARISFNFAVVRDYQGYDWLFSTNIQLEDVKGYVHIYKCRWGIETAFRVQDEVEIKSKSKDMRVRYFLFLFEALVYDLWQYFKNGVSMPPYFSFSAFVLSIQLMLLIEVLMDAVLEALKLEVDDRERAILAVADSLCVPRGLVTC